MLTNFKTSVVQKIFLGIILLGALEPLGAMQQMWPPSMDQFTTPCSYPHSSAYDVPYTVNNTNSKGPDLFAALCGGIISIAGAFVVRNFFYPTRKNNKQQPIRKKAVRKHPAPRIIHVPVCGLSPTQTFIKSFLEAQLKETREELAKTQSELKALQEEQAQLVNQNQAFDEREARGLREQNELIDQGDAILERNNIHT